MNGTVTLTAEQYRALKRAAELGETFIEWHARLLASKSSHAISAAENWAAIAAAPTYAELRYRRTNPGAMHAEFTCRHGHEYRGGPVDWATGRPARKAVAA